MSLAEKLTAIAENEKKVHEAGKAEGVKSEYDRFWDGFQDYGNRNDFAHSFGGSAWAADGLLPPKYPITLRKSYASCQGMFGRFNRPASIDYSKPLYDLSAVCDKIDFSKVTEANDTFKDARARNISVDLSGCTKLSYTFSSGDGGSLENITLKVTENLTTIKYAFMYQNFLTNLIFTEDSVIACSGLDLQWSTSLNKTSITSIINALSTTATGKSVTLSKAAVNKAFTTDEWKALTDTRTNWTISLV